MNTSCEEYAKSARRAADWIVARQRPDGSFFDREDGVGGYYKIPYALAVTGLIPAGVRLLRWVRAHHFTRDGDFRGPSRKARIAVHDDWPTYANAWLVQGAHRLGQFDLSFRGAEFLLRYQAPCGGFHAFENGQPYVECVGSSWAGLSELTVGNLESAGAAARCLERLVAGQPDADRFFFRMTAGGALVTEVPTDQTLSYCVDSRIPKQIYFHPGIAMAFLCRYHLATGDAAALGAAQTIFSFTQRCADDVYRFPPSGKLGLGCALLAAITHESLPEQAARTVADYLLETQQDNGLWHLPDEEIYSMIEDKDDPEVVMDVTAEFTTFLQEIAALL